MSLYKDEKKWNLKDLSQIPEEYINSTKVIIEELKLDGENPSEFYVKIEIKPDGIIVFHLWHESAFKLLEEANKKGYSIMGNPGGKCRDFSFDPSQNKIIEKWMWE